MCYFSLEGRANVTVLNIKRFISPKPKMYQHVTENLSLILLCFDIICDATAASVPHGFKYNLEQYCHQEASLQTAS